MVIIHDTEILVTITEHFSTLNVLYMLLVMYDI